MNLPKRRILAQYLNKIGHGGYRLGYQAGMGHGMQVRHCELDNCGAGWESQRVGQAAIGYASVSTRWGRKGVARRARHNLVAVMQKGLAENGASNDSMIPNS